MLNIKYTVSTFLLLLLFFSNAMSNVTAPASDSCWITKTIQANQWTQIEIPCKAPTGKNTIEAIISNNMIGVYGTDWSMLSFDPVTNSYSHITLKDSLDTAKGYWIIQLNQSITIKTPFGSQPVSVKTSTQCSTSECFEPTLLTMKDVQNQMLSNPFYHSVKKPSTSINTPTESQKTSTKTPKIRVPSNNRKPNEEPKPQVNVPTVASPKTPLSPTTNTTESTFVLHGTYYSNPIVDTSTIGSYTLDSGKIVNVVPIGYNIPHHALGADIASIKPVGGRPDIVVDPEGVPGAEGTLDNPIHINELNTKIAGRSNLNIVFRGGEHVYTSNEKNWQIRIDGDNNTFDAYQNEKVVLSGRDRIPTATTSVGWGSGGLLIKGNNNLWQRISITKMPFIGIRVDGNHNTFQAMQVYKCYGSGVAFYETIKPNTHQGLGGSYNTFKHSYIYLNSAEGVIDHPNYPGRYSDGAHTDGIGASLGTVGNILENLTVWENSDDGFDFWISKNSTVRNSISAFHGLGSGDGNGFKFGGARHTSNGVIKGDNVKVINCISFEDLYDAFSNNEGINSDVRNITAISGGHSNIWISPTSKITNSISSNGSDYIEGTAANFSQGITLDQFISVDPLSSDFARPKTGSDIINQGAYKGL